MSGPSAFGEHLRRYALIYVVGTLSTVTLAVLPGGASAQNAATGSGAVGISPYASHGASHSGKQASPGRHAQPSGARRPGGEGAAHRHQTGSPSASPTHHAAGHHHTAGGRHSGLRVGVGVTRGGFACRTGVAQLPYSAYAVPCVAKFTGNNGGATYNGVTRTTITFAYRHTSDSTGAGAAAVTAEAEAAGGVSPSVDETYVKKLVNYFNHTLELYGRHVVIKDFNGKGNGTDEQLGEDQVGACADADYAANTLHAFADLQFNGIYEYEPFAACAPRYHLMVPFGQLYYPESEFQKENPYVWSITTSCTLGSAELAEFLGKQVAPYPAKWAGTDGAFALTGHQRKFAEYVPSNPGYQQCAANTKHILETKYGVSSKRWDQYNYALDISQGPSDSNKAAIQFSADHDTSVVLSSDPIAPIFLTQAAEQQDYFPEWIITGVALTDQDNWAQLWNQKEVAGRMFGLSQLGSTAAFLNPKGEAARALHAAGVPLSAGSALTYFELLPIFDQLQAAGPHLTPASYAAGTRAMPRLGGATAADGTWFYGSAHTGIIDSREIYYVENRESPANRRKGTYLTVYGGRRFQLRQFPKHPPPFYP
ncbi:MAG TPA: hypothetical protein VG650_04175 [Mycobacteriales bacterium]|nr:hypothetical protein [Mycobacteriales bacterium]